MKIQVESCWGGGDNYYFRLTTPDGKRESVRGERWTRAVAAEALDLLERVYHFARRSVRFDHR